MAHCYIGTLKIYSKTQIKGEPIFFSIKSREKELILGKLIIDLYKFVIDNLFFSGFEAYFETHSCVINLMRSFFGDNFAIPMACEVLWDKIPHERMGFYKKFKTKEAGLFKANLSILKKIAPPIQMAVNY